MKNLLWLKSIFAAFLFVFGVTIGNAQDDFNIEHLSDRMFHLTPRYAVMRDSLLYEVGNDVRGRGQLGIFDVSDPTQPVECGYSLLPIGRFANALVLDGNYAFILHTLGIGLFNIIDSWHPCLVDTIEVNRPYCLALNDDVAYVSLPSSQLNVYSIGENHNFQLIDAIDVQDTLKYLTVYEDYLLAGGNHLNIYSIANPAEPQLIESYETLAYDIVVRDDYVYVATGADGVAIYILQDNGELSYSGGVEMNAAQDVEFWEDKLVASQERGEWDGSGCGVVSTYDLTDPGNPRRIGLLASEVPGGFNGWGGDDYICHIVATDYPVCFIVGYQWLIDNRISYESSQFEKLGNSNCLHFSKVIAGNYLFAMRKHEDVLTYSINIDNPHTPFQTAISVEETETYLIGGHGNYLFRKERLAWHNIKLRSYWIGEQGELELLDEIDAANYFADDNGGNSIISDNSLFINLNHSSGIAEIDISDPRNMQVVGEYEDMSLDQVAFDNERSIWYQRASAGLKRVDFSDPGSPVELEPLHPELQCLTPRYENGKLYVTADNHIYIYDVTDPENTEELAQHYMEDAYKLLCAKDDHLYVITRNDIICDSTTLHVLDVSDTQNICETGRIRTPKLSWGALTIRDGVLISNNSYDIGFYDISQALSTPREVDDVIPITLTLNPAYPNPFNGKVSLSFTLPNSSDCQMVIVDGMGRQVASLLNGVYQAGEYNISWTADDLPSGVYFARMSVKGMAPIERRLVLVK